MIGIYFVKITQNEGTHQGAFSFFKIMFPFNFTLYKHSKLWYN